MFIIFAKRSAKYLGVDHSSISNCQTLSICYPGYRKDLLTD
jgi:hypothetical protein